MTGTARKSGQNCPLFRAFSCLKGFIFAVFSLFSCIFPICHNIYRKHLKTIFIALDYNLANQGTEILLPL